MKVKMGTKEQEGKGEITMEKAEERKETVGPTGRVKISIGRKK